ncbi:MULTISPECIES: hypothetical protein [unclassified Massilia]|uniref:hypothetical protein n=1 Tax=unclassified Massilia TaxID=2609279 RepID=UPI0017863CB7|nr:MULTISPECIES: hypothetical protein [unclassified Massilia]MBD8531513.1 hypothetical protein [Massilia sp. CFBP 13647]MBD8673691.1 hypothetical protein [Massilia sp. CFBP 13721]
MNHNNQQPGSADLPPLPTPSWSRDMHGETEVYTVDEVRKIQRDAIAASRRALSLPDVAMPEQMRKALKDVTDVLDIFGNLSDGQMDPKAWNAAKAEDKITAARAVLSAQPAEGSADPCDCCKDIRAAEAIYGDGPQVATCTNEDCEGGHIYNTEHTHKMPCSQCATPAAVVRAAPAESADTLRSLSEEDICAFQHAVQQLEWIASGETPGKNCDLYDDRNKATIRHAMQHANSALTRLKPAYARLLEVWRGDRKNSSVGAAEGATQAGWQPIETAPKTGRELILLLTPSRFPQVAYSNTWWTSGFSVENKPTHWMPIPRIDGDKQGAQGGGK